MVDTLGNVEYDGDMETIHGRGNWTWGQEKKPYSIKLPNKTKLLGLKKAKKFNLLSQPSDPTGMRNWMALSAAKQMGLNDNLNFSFANVYLNGNYAGCYLMTNKVDREPQHNYLLEIDSRVDQEEINASFHTAHGIIMTIKKPKLFTDEEKSYVEREWQRVEDALMEDTVWISDYPIDSLIDMTSFVNNYLCQEVFKNMDAGCASFYMGKDRDGKFYADTIWDMDGTMSSPLSHMLGHELCRVIYAGAGLPLDNPVYSSVCSMLYKNGNFRHQVCLHYGQMKSIVKDLFWGETWNTIVSYLQTDMEINNFRWRDGANFEEQCNQIKNWMEERLRFLDWVWNEEDEHSKCLVTVYINESSRPIQYVIPRNTRFSEPLPAFNSVDVTNLGYEYTFTGYEIDGVPVNLDTLLVDKDITVIGKWKQTKEPSLYHRFRVWFWNLRHK